MITVGMSYEVLEGKEQVFERAFRGVVEAMRAEAGHVQTGLFKDVARPRSYLVVSEWASQDAFHAFVRSEAFARVTRWGAEQVLAGRPSHRVYG